ncbi:MAG: hypothetical protein E7222_02160 [Clostridiales bacterium]|nr:hypothetical protein [Clostridiales bacterium]
MTNKKLVLVLITLIIISAFIFITGCALHEKTTEYIFPEIVVNATGQTQESIIEELKPSGNRDDLVTSIRKGTDNSVIVEVTNKQREKWLADIEEMIEQCEKDAKADGGEINVNENRTEFVNKIRKDADMVEGVKRSMLVTTRSLQYQIFNGVDPNEIKLRTIIINIQNNKVMADATLEEGYSIDADDWEE